MDQSAWKVHELQEMQGIANMAESGPDDGGLVVMKGSAKLFDKFFKLHPPDRTKGPLAALHYDFYPFEESDVQWGIGQKLAIARCS